MLFIWIGGQFAKVQWEKCYLCYLFILIIAVVEWFCVPKGKLDRKKEKGEPHTAIPGTILFYTVMILFFGIFIFTFSSNISLFITQRSLGGTVEASYASIIYNLAGMVAGCVTGFVLSRLKYKVFSCSIIIAAVGMLLCFFSTGFPVLCIGAIFCGAAYSIAIPAGNYYASIESTDYNRSFSIALLNALSGGGMLISPIFFGTVLTMLTISQRFLASGIGMVLLLAAVCVGQRRMHRE
ncbi:MAG: MFS transporter [Lachnospiraceae bacterium]|nr:MFS transporter [Lachnospiraceae bacterium]